VSLKRDSEAGRLSLFVDIGIPRQQGWPDLRFYNYLNLLGVKPVMNVGRDVAYILP